MESSPQGFTGIKEIIIFLPKKASGQREIRFIVGKIS